MAKKDMLDQTRIVLEMLDESEEKVSLLCESFNQNNTTYQQIKDNLREIRVLRNKNLVELEDNQHLKDNIKKFNQQLLSFAQLIYRYDQELYSDLNLHEAELAKNEELLNRNEEMMEGKSNKYKINQIALTQKLEDLEKDEIEIGREKEFESKTLAVENEELEAEIKILTEEIEREEHCVKNESAVLDYEEKGLQQKIEDLQEHITCRKNEKEEFLESLAEAKQLKTKLESESEATLLDLERQISECEIEINESTAIIDTCQLNIDVIYRKIEVVEEEIKNKEKECGDYTSEINSTKINLTDLEDEYNKNLICRKELFLEIEEKFKHQEDATQQIETETSALKNKIEVQQESVQEILKFLAIHKTHPNLSLELKEKEETKEKLKTSHRQLKQDYDKRTSDLEDKLKRGHEEIETKERTNKKLQVDTDSLIAELEKLKNGSEKTSAQHSIDIEELDSEIQKLKAKVAQIKANKLKNKRKAADTNIKDGQASSTSTSDKEKRVRHWDSDSSVEGEDRRLSELIKQTMKKKRMAKINVNK